MLRVADDSGFLAVIGPAAYHGYVGPDWQFDQLVHHFRRQMSQSSMLIWGTGLEGCWKVDVRREASLIKGFREVSGPLQIVGGEVLVTNYESLTMAAQFEDIRLPEPHEVESLIRIPEGLYCCRIIQMFDSEQGESRGDEKADFVLEFTQPNVIPPTWSTIPWFKV